MNVPQSNLESPCNEEFVKRCAKIVKLPKHADLERFKKALDFAVNDYRRARESNPNKVYYEIDKLYRAARKSDPRAAKKCLEHLSDEARRLIEKRCQNNVALPRLPIAADFEGPNGAKACEAVEELCSYGGRWVPGRLRPNGKRSREWKPYLVAPGPTERPKRHGPERTLIMWLQLAVEEAMGTHNDGSLSVATTAALERPGPIVRLAVEVLKTFGDGYLANESSVVKMVNTLNDERRAARSEGMLEAPPQGLSGPNR